MLVKNVGLSILLGRLVSRIVNLKMVTMLPGLL